MRVPRKPTPREGLAGGTQEKDLAPGKSGVHAHGEGERVIALERELRAFFSCMAWRGIPSPVSKQHRRLDSL